MSGNIAVILDFDTDVRNSMRDALRQHGFEARFFTTVKEVAIDWAALRKAGFFIIAGDVPGDGLKVLKKVREDAEDPKAPVLFIVGDKSAERVQAVVAAKPDAVLVRPYTMKDLVARIEALAP